jgi:hypothetical protein
MAFISVCRAARAVRRDGLRSELRLLREDVHRITLELKERLLRCEKLQVRPCEALRHSAGCGPETGWRGQAARRRLTRLPSLLWSFTIGNSLGILSDSQSKFEIIAAKHRGATADDDGEERTQVREHARTTRFWPLPRRPPRPFANRAKTACQPRRNRFPTVPQPLLNRRPTT